MWLLKSNLISLKVFIVKMRVMTIPISQDCIRNGIMHVKAPVSLKALHILSVSSKQPQEQPHVIRVCILFLRIKIVLHHCLYKNKTSAFHNVIILLFYLF